MQVAFVCQIGELAEQAADHQAQCRLDTYLRAIWLAHSGGGPPLEQTGTEVSMHAL